MESRLLHVLIMHKIARLADFPESDAGKMEYHCGFN